MDYMIPRASSTRRPEMCFFKNLEKIVLHIVISTKLTPVDTLWLFLILSLHSSERAASCIKNFGVKYHKYIGLTIGKDINKQNNCQQGVS